MWLPVLYCRTLLFIPQYLLMVFLHREPLGEWAPLLGSSGSSSGPGPELGCHARKTAPEGDCKRTSH